MSLGLWPGALGPVSSSHPPSDCALTGSCVAPLSEILIIVSLILIMGVLCVAIGIHLRRHHRRPKPVTDEWSALAVMDELCPHGWQAQITLYGWDAPVPADAPASRAPLFKLEWKQFDEESEVAVARQVWAPTIGNALQTMVDDRRMDHTLEQIEQAAASDGDSWS